jgi:DNA repair exonuclease SbcCD ATPase subunit
VTAISLHPYVLFGLLEFLIVLIVLGAIMAFKWRAAQRKAESLSKELHKVRNEARKEIENTVVKQNGGASEPLPVYADFLREQLEQSSILLGDDPQIQSDQDTEDPSDVTRQMLAARHQFLQLELDVQSLSATRDVEAQRKSVVEGMQALLAGLVQHTAAQPETDEAAAAVDAETPISTSLSEEEKLRGQVDFLRNVVSNQHDVMHELRQLLEDHGGDSDELKAAMRKLGDAEKQGKELQRHLDAMENENARIKREQKENRGKQIDAASPDSDMLRDLVGNQQRTIGNLQNLLRNLPSDSGKTKELAEIINKIQRTNNDLSSCVMVLEDENDHLRDKVESLQKQIASLESPASAESETVSTAAASDVAGSAVEDVLDTVSTAEEAAVDLAEDEDDIDALLVKAAADAKAKPAESATAAIVTVEQKPADVEPTQGTSAVADDFDVDALLAASASAAKPASVDLADDTDDIDALLDATAADAKAKPEVPEPVTDVDPTEGVSADDDFNVDALLAAASPAAKDNDKQSEPAPSAAKSPSPTQSEAEQDDIDALLADLFADDNKAGDGSKS